MFDVYVGNGGGALFGCLVQEERSEGGGEDNLFTLFCLMILAGVNKLDKLIIKTFLIRVVTVQRETGDQK